MDMKKAVLIIDMPKSCIECPLCDKAELISEGNFLYKQLYRCKVEPEDVEDGYLPNIIKEKPEWCPLCLQEQRKEHFSVSDKNKLQTNADKIRNMSEKELADCLLQFSTEDIVYDWCAKLCPYRVKELPNKCKIDLEKNGCPCDTKDIVIHWLKTEVKTNSDYRSLWNCYHSNHSNGCRAISIEKALVRAINILTRT